MAAVEVQVRSPATVDANGKGKIPTVPVAADDPNMTTTRRTVLIARRRTHLAQWRAGLELLPHFNPSFPYDIAHEYGFNWTTDPDYSSDTVKCLELNEDGTVSSEKLKNRALQLAMVRLLLATLGRRAVSAPRLHFGAELGSAAGLYTSLREPSIQVEPDVVVLAPGTELSDRQIWDLAYDIDLVAGHPVPVLVAEILSDSTAARDLGGKRRLYETLGIEEYVLCDVLGGLLAPGAPDAPPGMVMYRLEEGVYRTSREAGTAPSVFRSNVLGAPVRLLPPPDPSRAPEDFRFQWYDVAEGRWRDPETDREHERVAEQDRHDRALRETQTASLEAGEARARLETAVELLHKFLTDQLSSADRDRIEASWRRDGPPTDAVDCILAVRQSPTEWRSLLRIPNGDRRGG